jgi:peptidoglycan/xylan/chitin deacetylase (PgdA/CDA1 family)
MFGKKLIVVALPFLFVTLSGCKVRAYNAGTKDVGPGVPEDNKQFSASNLRGKQFGLKRNEIALTFDDGPSYLTPKLGDALAKKGIRATWFVNFNNASDLANAGAQDMIRKLCSQGHLVGNHNDGHTYDTNNWEHIKGVHAKIKELCPNQQHIYYRAPGGSWAASDSDILNKSTDAAGKSLAAQYIGPVHWDVACDTEQNPAACQSKDPQVLADAYYKLIVAASNDGYGGPVVLGHDVPWHATTVPAIVDTNLIERLQADGYTFVTLDQNPAAVKELLGREPAAPPPMQNIAVSAKLKALRSTVITKERKAADALSSDLKCTVASGTAFDITVVSDVGSQYLKVAAASPISGCTGSFGASPSKDTFVYRPDFVILPRKCTIASDVTNVRSSPSTTSEANIIGQITLNTTIVPEGIDGAFYQFIYKGARAYAHKSQFDAACKNFQF